MGFNSGLKGLITKHITDTNIVTLAKHRLQAPWWWFS